MSWQRDRKRYMNQDTRRRWFRFGPGLAIAALLSAFIIYTRWDDARRQTPPRVERTVLTPAGQAGVGLAPEVTTLIARREELRLSAQQVSGLRRLQAEWERVSATDRAGAERAAAQFQAWMSDAQKRGRVSMADVQEHGAELSARSAQIAWQRRTYWDGALKLLSKEQRERASKQSTLAARGASG